MKTQQTAERNEVVGLSGFTYAESFESATDPWLLEGIKVGDVINAARTRQPVPWVPAERESIDATVVEVVTDEYGYYLNLDNGEQVSTISWQIRILDDAPGTDFAGAIVRYHGSQIGEHGEYRVDGHCYCHANKFALTETTGRAPSWRPTHLTCVHRGSFTVIHN